MRRYCLRLAILSLAALGPVAARGDDQQIAQEIVKKLQAEKQAGTLKGFSIDLQVDEGTVWLTGRVASEQQLARALDLARRVSGVQQVVNGLDVNAPPAKATARPAATASQPQPAYSAHPRLEPAPAARFEAADQPNTPAHSSVLNSVSKALMTAVHGKSAAESQPARMQMITAQPMPIHPEAAYAEPTPAEPEAAYTGVQAASVNQEFATLASAGPIGSGVSPSAAQRVSVQPIQSVQPMQTAASYPSPYQPVPTAQQAAMESPQPMPGYGPQGMPAAPYAQMAMVPMAAPYAAAIPVYAGTQNQVPLAMGPARTVNYAQVAGPIPVEAGAAGPAPMYMPGSGVGIAPARYDHPTMPGYAWPSYASHPNYAAVTYPKQYSPTAWPYIGPFYPYPQVPLGWRKVTLEWDDGWWMLDFKDRRFGGGHF